LNAQPIEQNIELVQHVDEVTSARQNGNMQHPITRFPKQLHPFDQH
jgi:hypothetical protein